jgi:hypothetical protein
MIWRRGWVLQRRTPTGEDAQTLPTAVGVVVGVGDAWGDVSRGCGARRSAACELRLAIRSACFYSC